MVSPLVEKLYLVLVLCFSGVILILDSVVPAGYSVGVLYVLPAVISAFVISNKRIFFLLILLFCLLIFGGLFLSRGDIYSYSVFFNRFSSMLIVCVTGFLSFKNLSTIKMALLLEEQFRVVVEATQAGMITVDEKGLIKFVNNHIETLFGYKKEELLGQSVEILVPERFKKVHKEHRKTLFQNSHARLMGVGSDLFGRRKDGSEFSIEVGLTPVVFQAKKEVLASVIDITKRKYNEGLRVFNEKLRQSNKDLEQFAYVVSHDLKAPLRGIQSTASWIVDDMKGKLDAKDKEYLDLLQQNVQWMQYLIDDILMYSKIGQAQGSYEKVDLNIIINEIIQTLQPPKSIEIKMAAQLPTVFFEKTRVKQVFQNIIDNAIKFMDKPKGTIEIFFEELESEYLFSIKDNGPGIEEKNFSTIFEIFKTLGPKDISQSSGLGLSIVERIIANFGGKIWVESKVGVGTTFHFTILKTMEVEK